MSIQEIQKGSIQLDGEPEIMDDEELAYHDKRQKAKDKFEMTYDNRRISHFIPTLYLPFVG
jgi:hypothetical protein